MAGWGMIPTSARPRAGSRACRRHRSDRQSRHRWKVGDRVTLPFVCGCGTCPQCASGNHQICDHQFQRGSRIGALLRSTWPSTTRTSIWCISRRRSALWAREPGLPLRDLFPGHRRAGKVSAGQWVAVHGCGGVGLSAIMIASALGANVVAVDINDEKLAFARSIGPWPPSMPRRRRRRSRPSAT
jgi:alcohol dehydrogenase